MFFQTHCFQLKTFWIHLTKMCFIATFSTMRFYPNEIFLKFNFSSSIFLVQLCLHMIHLNDIFLKKFDFKGSFPNFLHNLFSLWLLNVIVLQCNFIQMQLLVVYTKYDFFKTLNLALHCTYVIIIFIKCMSIQCCQIWREYIGWS